MNCQKTLKRIRLLLGVILLATLPSLVSAQERMISGTVTDAQGEPVPGATIVIEGTSTGTTTDIDGKYRLEASSEDILVFSFIGLKRQQIEVGAQTVIDVILEEDNTELDEVVVVGFGMKQKKESVVGAVAQTSGQELQKIKMGGSIENTLQGALPGLTVIQTDPTPGEEAMGGFYGAAPISMSIRGASSMGSNAPLLIVDGVERQFSNIDPNEIESISILKDASATAVYGVRGANGVIIVNTKRGVSGKIQLEYNSNFSIKEPTMLPEYMNAYETMLLRNEAYKNDGLWNQVVSSEVLEHYKNQDLPYLYPDFDWMDYLYGTGFDHQHNLNARGGNNFVKYFVSVGYLSEGDVMNLGDVFPYEYDGKDAAYFHRRYNFRNNLDFNVTKSTTLSVSLGGNIKKWGKPIDIFTQENWFQPVTALPFYPAEALDQYPDELIPYDQNGPRPYINPNQGDVRLYWNGGQGFRRLSANEILSDVKLDQKLDFLLRGLSVSALYSYNSQVRYQKNYNVENSAYYGYYLNPNTLEWTRYNSTPGNVDYDTPPARLIINNDELLFSSLKSHYYQGQIAFDRTFGKHTVGAVGIFSRRQVQDVTAEAGVVSYPFPSFQENWVGRVTYNYDSKYFIEGSIAHSGSEKFAPGLRFGTFPAMGAGWIISNEDFFEPVTKVVNHLKVRYSYGVVGSDAGIDRWLYRSTYSANTDPALFAYFGYPRQTYTTLAEGAIPVTNATWEEAIKQNLGVEMSFFNNQVTLSVDLFNELRTGLLQQRQSVPSYVGVTSIQGNLGETKSHGMEIQLGVNKPMGNGWFLWFTGNVTMSENRLVEYDESDNVPYNLKLEGKPVDIARRGNSRGLLNEGFYQDFDELFMLPNGGGSPIVGDLKYLDFNGDGNLDAQDYVVAEDPLTPNITWNARIGVDYKNWSASANFYGIGEVARLLRGGGEFYLYPFTQNKDNAFTAHANHWTPDNTDPEFPAVHAQATNQYNFKLSNFAMIAGQYVRLRNVRLGYTIKSKALSKIGISEAGLALVGTNLFTWKALGWGGDPEGFNFGEDFGAYPQLRRYTLELRLLF